MISKDLRKVALTLIWIRYPYRTNCAFHIRGKSGLRCKKLPFKTNLPYLSRYIITSYVMPTQELVTAPWHHEESLLIRKVYFFPQNLLLSRRICLSYS